MNGSERETRIRKIQEKGKTKVTGFIGWKEALIVKLGRTIIKRVTHKSNFVYSKLQGHGWNLNTWPFPMEFLSSMNIFMESVCLYLSFSFGNVHPWPHSIHMHSYTIFLFFILDILHYIWKYFYLKYFIPK